MDITWIAHGGNEMHAGTIHNPKTTAGRLYRRMKLEPGTWFDAWNLAIQMKTTALSTRISEIRSQLPANERIEHEEVNQNGRRRQFYRIVSVPVQKERGCMGIE